MITLLHAFPVNQELLSSSPEARKYQMAIPNYCKNDILETLEERGKNLNLKFEVLTGDTFRIALETGSRILYLGSEVLHPDGIVVERAKGGSELFTYPDIKRLFMGSKVKRFQAAGGGLTGGSEIEMVIVGTKNDEKFANFLSQELQIKHVIYFKFNREKFKDCYRQQLYENVYVTKFMQFFLNELVTCKSVQRSFDLAQLDTINCVADSFFNSNLQEATEYMSPGAILLPDITELNFRHEKLFGVDNYILPDGKPEDISTRKPPSNVRKILLPFFGRVQEMETVFEKVLSQSDTSNNNHFIKIQGAPGVGKTRFVLELAYRLLQRNCFKDGIFYIPLRRMKTMTFFELLEHALNPQGMGQRINKNLQSFFRDKTDILLIIDDFDLFYSEQIEFPSRIFPTLKRSKVKVIVTCTKYEFQGELDNARKEFWERFKKNQAEKEAEYVGKTYDLTPLENEHLAHLVVSLTDTNIDGITEEDLLNYPRLLQVQGIPQLLIRKLQEKKLFIKNKQLLINPYLTQYLDLDKRYGQIIKTNKDPISRANVPNASRFSNCFTEYLKQLSEKEKMTQKTISYPLDDDGLVRSSMDTHNRESVYTTQQLVVISNLEDNTPKTENLPQFTLSEEEKKVERRDTQIDSLPEEVKEENESESEKQNDSFHLSGVKTESSGVKSSQSIESDEEPTTDGKQ